MSNLALPAWCLKPRAAAAMVGIHLECERQMPATQKRAKLLSALVRAGGATQARALSAVPASLDPLSSKDHTRQTATGGTAASSAERLLCRKSGERPQFVTAMRVQLLCSLVRAGGARANARSALSAPLTLRCADVEQSSSFKRAGLRIDAEGGVARAVNAEAERRLVETVLYRKGAATAAPFRPRDWSYVRPANYGRER